MSEYISVNEARQILGIDEDAMLDLIVDNKIRNRKIDGENRVLAEDVEAYRQTMAGGQAATPPGGGLELDALELVDDGVSAPQSTVVLEEHKSAATEVIADQGGVSTTSAAPLRTEELFFEDDDPAASDDGSRTQDVTVIEEVVPATASAPVATVSAASAGESLTEEFTPEETPRDAAARKRGHRAPAPIRRASVAASARRGGAAARRGGGADKKGAKAQPGAALWTAVLVVTALLVAWPLVMMISLVGNGSYANQSGPSNRDTSSIPNSNVPGHVVQVAGSDLMPMWKADWFKSFKQSFVGDQPVLVWTGDRPSFNNSDSELFGRPKLDVNAVADDFRTLPPAPTPEPVEDEGEGDGEATDPTEGEEAPAENAENAEEADPPAEE